MYYLDRDVLCEMYDNDRFCNMHSYVEYILKIFQREYTDYLYSEGYDTRRGETVYTILRLLEILRGELDILEEEFKEVADHTKFLNFKNVLDKVYVKVLSGDVNRDAVDLMVIGDSQYLTKLYNRCYSYVSDNKKGNIKDNTKCKGDE